MFTEEMVHTALQTWCDNVVAVGKVHAEGGDAKAFASKVLSENSSISKKQKQTKQI